MPSMRRREFITLLGGAAVAWPLAARAQQAERMRRIGVLDHIRSAMPRTIGAPGAFPAGTAGAGLGRGRNLRIDTAGQPATAGRIRSLAAEIVATGPEVIFAGGFSTFGQLDATTRSRSCSQTSRSGRRRLRR